MKISVVILNWNGRNFLEKFLPSVIAGSAPARVVVADNGSNDDSLVLLDEMFGDQIDVVALDRNYGFAEGYNRALERVDADIFVLLNSDVDVTKGWLEPITEIFEREPNVAAVQPKILSFGRPSHFEYAGASGGFIDALGYPFCRGRLIAECEADEGQYDDEREIFWATGAAMVIRAEAYRKAGGLDALFFAHMEEIDLCWRLRRMGYAIKVAPQSTVYHVGAGTLPVWSPMKTYLNFRNNIAMLYKNLSTPRFLIVYLIRFATDSLRAVSYALTGKWKFAAAIFRGHRDFWRTRRKYPKDKSIPKQKAGQIYRGSIVLYYIFKNRKFSDII